MEARVEASVEASVGAAAARVRSGESAHRACVEKGDVEEAEARSEGARVRGSVGPLVFKERRPSPIVLVLEHVDAPLGRLPCPDVGALGRELLPCLAAAVQRAARILARVVADVSRAEDELRARLHVPLEVGGAESREAAVARKVPAPRGRERKRTGGRAREAAAQRRGRGVWAGRAHSRLCAGDGRTCRPNGSGGRR